MKKTQPRLRLVTEPWISPLSSCATNRPLVFLAMSMMRFAFDSGKYGSYKNADEFFYDIGMSRLVRLVTVKPQRKIFSKNPSKSR